MKKRMLGKKITALAAASVIALSLTACSSSGSSEESSSASSGTSSSQSASSPSESSASAASSSASESSSSSDAGSSSGSETIKVGFSSAAYSDEWCHNLALTFESLAGDEYPEIETVILDGNGDSEKQINTIQSLISQDLDYIAVQPLPGTETALQEVVDAGIPLFCVDMVPTSDTLVWTQVGVDETEFGKLQAEALAEVLPENGTVCIAMNQLGQNSQINRTKGFEDTIAELRPDVTILDEQPADSKTDKAMSLVEDWIQRFGEDGIDAIVCQSAMTVQGVVESLKAHDLTGKIYVAAQDFTQPSGTEWLESGATYVDVFYDYYELVRGVYDAIMDYEENGTELPEEVLIEPSVWTKDNVAEFEG